MPWKNLENGLSISELAKICDGKIIGNTEQMIFGICTLDQPNKTHLAYSSSKSSIQVSKLIKNDDINTLIISDKLEIENVPENKSLILVKHPQKAVLKILPSFFENYKTPKGVSKNASIHSSTKIGENTSIGDFCSIAANCQIGNNVTIHPHVVLYQGVSIGDNSTLHSGAIIREDTVIESNCVIQNGAVIGSDGFGYILNEQQVLETVPQIGTVNLASNVDVGSNSCIDRATLGVTTINKGTKIDNQVQIGHNVIIGQSSIVCGQAGIAGSAKIGNGVVLGGQTGVADHIKIADGARVASSGTVLRNIEAAGDYLGNPAQKASSWQRQAVLLSKLDKIYDKVKSLSKQLQD